MLVAKCIMSVRGAEGTWCASFYTPWPTDPAKWAGTLMMVSCAMSDLLVDHPSLNCNKGEACVGQDNLENAETWSIAEKWHFSGDTQHTPWVWTYKRFPEKKGGRHHG